MFRFEGKRSSENNWAGQCVNKGRGGKCSTRSGWLMEGKHEHYTLGNGHDIECEACHDRRTRVWLRPEHRECGHIYLSEEEKTLLKERLAEGRKAFETLEARTLAKIGLDRTTKPTARQGKL